MPRHNDGLLIEGADTNIIGKNTGDDQQDIDLRWNDRDNGCLRAFFFEDNLNDEMGVANGTGANITYTDSDTGYGKAVASNGDTSYVNCGSGADIDDLTTFSVAFLLYPKSAGEANAGRIFNKNPTNPFTVHTGVGDANNVTLTAYSAYGTTNAHSRTDAIVPINDWTYVVVTYDEAGDRVFHIYLNGVEATYELQQASVGTKVSDAAADLYLLNRAALDNCLDGNLDRFLLYNRVLTAAEIDQLGRQAASAFVASSDSTVNLYGGYSQKLLEGTGAAKQFYQPHTLTAEKYIVSCLAYTDGSAVTSADVETFADTAFTNEIATTNFEHQGSGVYLCWGEFTATAATWNVGVEVKANKTVYVSLLSCYKAAPTKEGGDFPRSLIPNATTGSMTRAPENLTLPADGNINPDRGTVDVEFVAPCSEAEVAASLQVFNIFRNTSDVIRAYVYVTNDNTTLEHKVAGVGRAVTKVLGFSRGDIVKLRLSWDVDTVDGTNYVTGYGRVNDGAWAAFTPNANALGGSFPSGGIIYVGRYGGSNEYHLASTVRRLRIWDEAKAGPPDGF